MRRVISVALATTALIALGSASYSQAQLTGEPKLPADGKLVPIPNDVKSTFDSFSTNAMLPLMKLPIISASAFSHRYKIVAKIGRGEKNIAVFRQAAPAVVKVISKKGEGSGSLIEGGMILTNWHVVEGSQVVNILFKPEGLEKPQDSPVAPLPRDLTTAKIVKVDPVHDLALLQLAGSPPRPIDPIKIAQQDTISVGADVHAIGHPGGEAWSYTTGFVSQIRPDYAWRISDIEHRATVIQTQTPINPGNSGGPLLSNDAQIVGVNTFQAPERQGLNYAVSAKDIRNFLDVAASAATQSGKPCTLAEGRNNDGYIRIISLACDGKMDVRILVPDNPSAPVQAWTRSKYEGVTVSGIIVGDRKSNKWSLSFWDVNGDNTFALRGIHPDGELLPSTYEPRCAPPSKALPAKTLAELKCS